MKKKIFYMLPILLIVLGIWLLNHRQGSKTLLEDSEPKALSYDTIGSNARPIHTTVNHERSKISYLDPLYDVAVQRDIVYASKKNETDTEEALKLDLYTPTNDNNKMRPIFIFIHGGGYKEGSKADGATISTELAKRGYVVLSMNYRLKKDPLSNITQTLSDDYEDIRDVIGWINNNAATYGLDAGHLAIGGDSAGGHLSINFANAYLKSDPSIVKSIFGIVDLYGGSLDDNVQPHLPPVLIVHGTIDTLIPYQQSLELSDSLARNGIYHNLFTMEGAGHDYKNAKYKDEIVERVSHFLWNVRSRPPIGQLPEDAGIVAVSGDPFDLTIPPGYIRDVADNQFIVTLPEGWSLGSNEGDQSFRVQVPTGLDQGNYSLVVTPGQSVEGGPGFAINVNVIAPLSESFATYLDPVDQKIKTHLQITNRSPSYFSGSLQVAYETAQASKGTFSAQVDQLEPGKSATFTIPELARGKRTLKGFNASGTLLQTTEDMSNTLLVHKHQKPIQIDGNLAEWKDQVRFDVSDVKMAGWKGKEDASANGYLSWDENNLYIAVEATDDVHAQKESGSEIWRGDSVQIAVAITNSDGTAPSEYHELGVALDDNNRLSQWRWTAPMGFSADGSVKVDQAISRKDHKTIYEMAIPWSELTEKTALVKQGLKIKFSLLVNDNDGDERKGWLEFNSGIGAGKDINAFGDLFLAE
ncbi:sugar-binding protein [Cohnella mopanensis]|uniref:sugar-binding protein n=1 Tax=Cohnella mopanensis TaxID=2911966 RepID=UPI001EF9B3CD|nr:sugar-binding protein [Cohnella mopanensis]